VTDIVSKAVRSRMMAGIRAKDTKPERVLRTLLHRAGFRYRLHGRQLPGRPDIVLARHRTVIFVHGCFWHRHSGCRFAYSPVSNSAFWRKKFAANLKRDQLAQHRLLAEGWRVLVVWECAIRDATRDPAPLIDRITTWIGTTGNRQDIPQLGRSHASANRLISPER